MSFMKMSESYSGSGIYICKKKKNANSSSVTRMVFQCRMSEISLSAIPTRVV